MDLQPMMPLSPRRRALLRWEDLQRDRTPYIEEWRAINDYVLPRRFRYLTTDKKPQRNTKMINGTATRSMRVLMSGMMAGLTSPSRPWIRLDSDAAGLGSVSQWLAMAGTKVLAAFRRSNIYNCLPKQYGDMAAFGIGATYIESDPEDLIRGFVLPIGQYCVANNARGRVDTIYREFTLSVENVIDKFGWESVSNRVKELWRARKRDEQVELLHCVEPRRQYDPEKADNLNMPFRSLWLEKNGGDDVGVLRESGYKRFPFLVARWDTVADDAYGTGLGVDALGDAQALQLLERRKAQAVDKITNPPMVGPSGLRLSNVSLVPNGVTTVDVMQGGQQFRPAVEVNPAAIREYEASIGAHELRIKQTFMSDLWLMLASSDRREITAREVDEKHEEKMLQLGPVVDRLNDELIDPLVEITLNELIDRQQIPPPPQELIDAGIKVDNISIMGQAQKLVGTVGLERAAGFVGNIAAVNKEILDNIDFDKMVRAYADMLGVDPSLLTDSEKMAALRSARAQQEQAQQMGAAAQPLAQGAQAAKVMSETDVNGEPLLNRMLDSIGAV